MDRNNIIGIGLLILLFLVWVKINQPSAEEMAEMAMQDSLAQVEQLRLDEVAEDQKQTVQESTMTMPAISDSVALIQAQGKLGAFAPAAIGTEKIVSLENDKMRVDFSTKGGKIVKVELKDHTVSRDKRDSIDIVTQIHMMDHEKNRFEYLIPVGNLSSGYVSTEDLIFQASQTGNRISFKAATANGGYVEQVYNLNGEYALDYDLRLNGLDQIVDRSNPNIKLNWVNYLNKLEGNDEYEKYYSSVYFKEVEESPDYCNCRGDAEEDADGNPVKWISHSNQFFNTSLIADNTFQSGYMQTIMIPENEGPYDPLKILKSEMVIPFDQTSDQVFGMQMYLGPNEFQTLRDYDVELEQLIPFGASFFGTINRWFVRPFFNFLYGFIGNMGWAIVIMTLIIKVVLSPLMYKMLYSQSKMSALKPKIDEMKKKLGDDAQKAQMETMKLYREYGANPLGGCMPMALQMPIWIALYRFFPASIDFRQQPFLWADDLSSFDVFFYLPNGWDIPFLGAHISLFTILWAVTTLIYTYYNTRHMDMSANPAMKYMQYLMPVMFFGFFNTYASGLTCYLFFSNLTNITQTVVTKSFIIDKDKVMAEMEAYKASPKAKKAGGGFQERLQKALEQQQQVQKKQEAKKKKGKK